VADAAHRQHRCHDQVCVYVHGLELGAMVVGNTREIGESIHCVIAIVSIIV
jgi:hypothetical protein